MLNKLKYDVFRHVYALFEGIGNCHFNNKSYLCSPNRHNMPVSRHVRI